jgi:hypothetical protein
MKRPVTVVPEGDVWVEQERYLCARTGVKAKVGDWVNLASARTRHSFKLQVKKAGEGVLWLSLGFVKEPHA